MTKGYWVVDLDVQDADKYAEYVSLVRPFLEKVGGKFLTRGGQCDVEEGDVRSRVVVIEFESYAHALACYDGDEYQSIKAFRVDASIANFVVTEGL